MVRKFASRVMGSVHQQVQHRGPSAATEELSDGRERSRVSHDSILADTIDLYPFLNEVCTRA